MAKPSWLNVSPQNGSGNGSISNSASAHTGREIRTGTVTVTGSGVAQPKTYTVNHEAKPEFVTFDNGSSMAADKEGGQLTVSGKSNSASLNFTWVGDGKEATIAATYTAGGKSTNNGEAIQGDPGASAEYNFEVKITIPANESVEQVDRVLKVTGASGMSVTAQITIEQSAGDAFIEIDPTSITIPQDGSAQTVNVTSNTTWTVS